MNVPLNEYYKSKVHLKLNIIYLTTIKLISFKIFHKIVRKETGLIVYLYFV